MKRRMAWLLRRVLGWLAVHTEDLSRWLWSAHYRVESWGWPPRAPVSLDAEKWDELLRETVTAPLVAALDQPSSFRERLEQRPVEFSGRLWRADEVEELRPAGWRAGRSGDEA